MKEVRLLSRRVIVDGVDCGLCMVKISPDGQISATEFRTETHSTVYIPHTIILSTQHCPQKPIAVHQSAQTPGEEENDCK